MPKHKKDSVPNTGRKAPTVAYEPRASRAATSAASTTQPTTTSLASATHHTTTEPTTTSVETNQEEEIDCSEKNILRLLSEIQEKTDNIKYILDNHSKIKNPAHQAKNTQEKLDQMLQELQCAIEAKDFLRSEILKKINKLPEYRKQLIHDILSKHEELNKIYQELENSYRKLLDIYSILLEEVTTQPTKQISLSDINKQIANLYNLPKTDDHDIQNNLKEQRRLLRSQIAQIKKQISLQKDLITKLNKNSAKIIESINHQKAELDKYKDLTELTVVLERIINEEIEAQKIEDRRHALPIPPNHPGYTINYPGNWAATSAHYTMLYFPEMQWLPPQPEQAWAQPELTLAQNKFAQDLAFESTRKGPPPLIPLGAPAQISEERPTHTIIAVIESAGQPMPPAGNAFPQVNFPPFSLSLTVAPSQTSVGEETETEEETATPIATSTHIAPLTSLETATPTIIPVIEPAGQPMPPASFS